MKQEKYNFDDLLKIMKTLRGENGCPWDKEQDHKSIKYNLIEEAYETLEGIESGNRDILVEELGDLLLQVVFHAQIGQDNDEFSIDDVTDGICRKLILRHPHIFSDAEADTSDEVLDNWFKIKKEEKGFETYTDVLNGVSNYFPALIRSQKVQKSAAKVGFDWDKPEEALLKIREETDEVQQALELGDKEKIEEEIGDLLFAAVNTARLAKVDSELTLNSATDKFIKRFSYMEQHAQKEFSKNFDQLSLEEMNILWEKAKNL